MRSPFSLFDPWILRRPFEGAAARRYTGVYRYAFGGLDERILTVLERELKEARTVLDLGAGTGQFAMKLADVAPGLVLALEPSETYTRQEPQATRVRMLRARAESLPLATASIDVAVCLSSLRHVKDRRAALRELRRVVRKTGCTLIVELDPSSGPARRARHTDAMPSFCARTAFRYWVLGTCPPAAMFVELARHEGFRVAHLQADPEQPFYFLRLS